MPRLLDRANVGYGFPTPTAGDRGAGQQAMWDALQALGVQQGATTTITASQTLTMSNCGEVLVSAASGNVTLTLPTSGTVTDNAVFVFVRTDSSANTVTIQRGSTDTIEGSTSISLALNQRTTIVMPAGGTVWRKISDTTATGLPDFLNTVRIDVASATTVDLTTSSPNTRNVNFTGTTNISNFTIQAGQCYFARFAAALTLVNSASLVTQTGANITTAAGDTCFIRATSANTVEILFYTPAGLLPATSNPQPNGTAAVGTSLRYAREDHVHAGGLTVNTSVSTTSGTSVSLTTSIPSTANRVSILFNNTGTNGSSSLLIQGGAGSFENTGYQTSARTGTSTSTSTAGFIVNTSSAAAATTRGKMTLDRATGNTWIASGSVATGATEDIHSFAGVKTFSGALSRLQITTVNGTDAFDEGSVTVTWE